jgi:hypothetical protein
MKEKVMIGTLLLVALFLTLAPTTFASTTGFLSIHLRRSAIPAIP